jgi:hypothetical protein
MVLRNGKEKPLNLKNNTKEYGCKRKRGWEGRRE